MATVQLYETAVNMRPVIGLDAADSTQDTLLTTLLSVTCEAIDDYTHRHFGTTGTTRYYDAPASATLLTHDLKTITALTVDGTALTTNDYAIRPLSGVYTRDEPSTTQIVRMSGSGGVPIPWASRGSYSVIGVTAAFDYVDPITGNIPFTITQVNQIMCARLYKRRMGGYENERGANEAGFEITTSPKAVLDADCKAMLDPYRRRLPYRSKPAWKSQ